MITRIALEPTIRNELFSQARSASQSDEESVATATNGDPLIEICGVLGGRRRPLDTRDVGGGNRSGDDGSLALITACRRVPNVADRPRTNYELSPGRTLDAIETLESDGLEHLGFYHSHPRGPAGPSRTDHARATWPGYVYLIVSLGDDPVIGAWRWTDETFAQLPVEIVGSDHSL